MSTVRMCDRCGTIFPEGIDGSAVGTVTVMRRDPETHRSYPIQQTQDQCPPCAGGETIPAPRLTAITTASTVVKDDKR